MRIENRVDWIRERLQESLNPSLLNIQDDSAKHAGHEGAKDGAGHFTVEISSPLFVEKPLIQCHRMVYDALEEAIPSEIHALKIKVRV
jgi:BolA protein